MGLLDNYGYGGGSGLLPFDDRWAPVLEAMRNNQFDPQGQNAIGMFNAQGQPQQAMAYAQQQGPQASSLPSPVNVPGRDVAAFQQPPQAPMAPQPQQPIGGSDPMVAGLTGFLRGKSLMGAIAGAIEGGTTGQRTDAPFALQQQQSAAYTLAKSAGLGHREAVAFAQNPEAQKQLFSQQLEQQKLAKPVVVPYGADLLNPDTGKSVNPEGTSGGLQDQAKDVAEAIKSGRQPPVLTGLYRVGPAVRSTLEKGGFNLANAQVEWTRAQKQIQALNGPQMTRFVGLADSVDKTIDEVRELSKQMQLSGIPKLNAVELAAYIQTMGNTPNGQLATRYIGAVNTLKEEFANLANGGYAPTEPAWKLANEQINSHYGDKQMDAALTEVQRLIRYRRQAIPNIDTLGPGAANRYAPPSAAAPNVHAPQAPAAAEAQAPADIPAIVPPPNAVQALRANPKLVPQFEAKYGKGSAAKYLNTRPTLQM